MYFDAVVDATTTHPYFNGTREEILEWLDKTHQPLWIFKVVEGHSLKFMTVDEYKAMKV